MKVLKFFLILFVVSTTINSCKEESKNIITTAPVAFTKEGNLTITKQKADTHLIELDIEFAQTEYETQTGLMYRKGMDDHQGMLFIFEDERMHSFYMKNTEFPLDIIYIKADSTIASFQENAQPFNETGLSSQVPIQYVLEVNAGLAEKWLLEVGDKIEYHKN